MFHDMKCLLFSSGEELETDFIFTCIGNKTQTDLTSAITALELNERGQVKVDRTDLHVIGEEASNFPDNSESKFHLF